MVISLGRLQQNFYSAWLLSLSDWPSFPSSQEPLVSCFLGTSRSRASSMPAWSSWTCGSFDLTAATRRKRSRIIYITRSRSLSRMLSYMTTILLSRSSTFTMSCPHSFRTKFPTRCSALLRFSTITFSTIRTLAFKTSLSSICIAGYMSLEKWWSPTAKKSERSTSSTGARSFCMTRLGWRRFCSYPSTPSSESTRWCSTSAPTS